MNVAEHLVQQLVAAGVDTVFTVPGEQHDAIFKALGATDVRVVQTRHEQSAAFMAYGYARSTGRIAACLVISGPGVLNAATALATAYAANARVLCIAAQVATPFLDRGIGVPHELPDQLGVLTRLTGWTARIERPDDVVAVTSEALHRLGHGRPRPVAIEVPTDVMSAEVARPTAWTPPPAAPPVDEVALLAARRALTTARTPMIYVGSGAADAAAEIQALAELVQAPVASEVGGRGVLPAEHELSITFPVAHRLWPDVDVLLAVGTRLRRPLTEWGVEGLRIIRVDLDEAEAHRMGAPEVSLTGDAQHVTSALLRGLPASEGRHGWLDAVAAARRSVTAEMALLQPQTAYLHALRDALPDNGFFVDELTQVGYAAWAAFAVRRPRSYVSSTYFGALGYGFAAALGVKAAFPDRPVLSISGDGGFLYTAVELATAVQHRLAVVAVVFDDASYTNVERSQRRSMSEPIATDLVNPDFVAFAESFGAVGVRAQDPTELRTEIEKGLARRDLPTVVAVRVDPMPDPWRFIRLPRVR